MKLPPLDCHITDMSLASAHELHDRARTAAVVREPLFKSYGAEAGTKTCGETNEPKTVDRDRDAGGLEGEGWVGFVFEAWVAAIQNLVKKQG